MSDNYENSRPLLFSVGDIVIGEVVMWRPFGIFVEFENGAEGVVDVLSLDPDGGTVDWNDVPKVGENIEAVVLEVKNDFSYLLTLRRKFWFLKEEWRNYVSQLEMGRIVSGAIDQNGDLGIFVSFEGGRGKLVESDIDLGDYKSLGRIVRCQIIGVDNRLMHVLLKQV